VFLNPPCYRNAQKRDIKKKKIVQNNEGEKQKTGGKKGRIFCDERRWIFSIFFIALLNPPLSRNAQKRDKKKSIKNKNKNKN
jgi:hypothetical protein